jgi:uncharacterized protein with FMN-binding domain
MTSLPPEDPAPSSTRPASLGRRLIPAVLVLGAGGALIWALDRPGSIAPPVVTDLAVGGGVTTTVPPTVTPTTTRPGQGSTTTTVPANRPTTTVPVAPTCSGTTRSVTGPTITTRFGPVQVAAVVDSGKKLCSLSAPQSPSNDRRSQSINAQAIPILNSRGVTTGSTSFSGVSGATYTSTAYKQSLQSILDQL